MRVNLRGDEFFSWHETAAGYAIVKDPTDKFWKFARPASKRAEFQALPGARVGTSDPASLRLKKHAMPDAKALRTFLEERHRTVRGVATARATPSATPEDPPTTPGVIPPPLGIPVSGTKTIKNIVILACFSDHWNTAAGTVLATRGRVATAEYANLFNQVNHTTDGAVGSVRDYYAEVSYGKLTVASVITPWVKLPQTEAYYDENSAVMVTDAINAAATAGFEFSQGDSDGDGWVDGLTLIHSGYGEELSGNPTTCIWSHQGSMSTLVTKNAVKMLRYHTEPALRGWTTDAPAITRIGVICHEMGHYFGLPDLYDYSETTDGLGDWCLMANGSWNGTSGSRPAHFSAWPKCFLGFVNPEQIHSQSGISLARVEDNPVVKLLRNGMSNNEYYLIENRSNFGFDNDSAIFPGILIYHIDGKSTDNDLGTWSHPAVKIEEADGNNSLGAKTASSQAGDVWTSTSGLAGGFRDQTGNQNTNAMLYQAGQYSRPDSATYYSYNTLSNFSAAGNPMTFNALTLKTSVGSQTSSTGNYTVSWPACAQATQYEIQEGAQATLTSFTDGAENEDAMYDNWYLAGTVKMDSAGKRTGSYSYAMNQYFNSKWGSSMQALTLREPFKVASSTVVSFYLMSHLTTGSGYLKCQISNDTGNTWKTLGTYDGYINSWSSRSYNYTAMNAAGIVAGDQCILRFVASFEQASGWDAFPGHGYALDDISITNTEISGYSGWTTLASNVTATNYNITGKTGGTYAYRVRAYANGGWQGYGAVGETMVDLPPTVTINQAAGQTDPASASPINFTVVFSRPVTGFTTGDVTITGTAGGTKTATVTGSGSTYEVAVTGMIGTGTVVATVTAGVAFDLVGNPNFASTSTDNTVTRVKADPVVTTWPAASSITYGQTLAAATLTGGAATPSGTFAFTSPATAPNAGTFYASVTFTPTDIANFNLVTSSVSVLVAPAEASVTTWPTASAITYGQTLADSTLNGGVAVTAGAFGFTTPTDAPEAGTASHSVTFTPTDSSNYTAVTGTVAVTVAKAASSVTTWPTASPLTYGQTLADSTLSDGVATPDGSFAFAFPATAPPVGTAAQTVTFTPSDTTNYEPASGPVNVTVDRADPSVTDWPSASQLTYGQTLANSILTGGTATPAGSFAFTTPATAPNAGTAPQSVTFTPTDTAHFKNAIGTVSVVVNKADSVVTTWPTASAIAYRQTLANSTLTGGEATPPGTFAFTSPTIAPSVGTAAQEVTFTPTDAANFNPQTGTVEVLVTKADPVVTTWPSASAITYGQTLANSTLTGGSGTPAGTFAFTSPTTAPNAGTAPQNVTFTPTSTANYNPKTGTVNVLVNKADSVVTTWPTASPISYGQTLADATLNGGVATPAGTFAFTNPATAPNVGTTSQGVIFTPTDAANFKTKTGAISVVVNKLDPAITAWPTATAITYGQNLTKSTLSGGVATPAGTFAFTTPTTIPSAGTASHSVTFTPTDTTHYKTVIGTASVLVNKADPVVSTWPTASAISYGQNLTRSTLSGGSGSPAGTFAFTSPTTAPDVGTAAQSVTFTPTNIANYNPKTGTVNVTVNKADPVITTWPIASAITYGETLADSVLSGGIATPEGSFAFTTPATAPNVGTASQGVTFTPTDTDHYNLKTGTASVVVNKIDPSVTAWPTATAITYGQNLTRSTLSGGVATPAGTFTFTASATIPSAGLAAQSVTFTPTDTTHYKTAIGTANVLVNKANPVVSTWPTASAITYGETLADSVLSGGTATPAGSFTFTTPTTAPDPGTAAQAVTFTPTDTANYNLKTGTVNVLTNKIDSIVTTWPTASAITYGQTLADSILSGGVATPLGSFAFTTPTTAPDAGTGPHSVTFTPTDAANYNAVTGSVAVTVTVIAPNPDANGNGILDSWETTHFGTADPGSNSATADPDHDGLTNFLEYALNTDPLQATISPLIYDFATIDGSQYLQLTVPKNPAATNLQYSIEVARDPTGPWSSTRTVTESETSVQFRVRDLESTTTSPRHFIRMKVVAIP